MYNLQQSVSGHTHKRGHTLDLVIVRPTDGVHRSSDVTCALESDHSCVISIFNMELPTTVPVYRTVRNIRAIDRNVFREDLKQELEGCVDCTADQYNTTLKAVLDKHAPASRHRVSSKRTSCPWFSILGNELLGVKKERRHAEAQWRASGLTIHEQLYQKAKNVVTTLVHKAKTMFFCTKISEAKSSKELYHVTNQLCARTKCTPLPSVYPFAALPGIFSDFFIKKIQNLRDDLDSQPTVPHPIGKDFQGLPLTDFSPVSEKDVFDVLKKSAPKTCDLDPLPTPLLYECLDVVVPTLTKIINVSLTTGVFPDIFKNALVKPLLKKTSMDRNDLKSFRPVSNLAFVSKIMEKVVLSQLSKHLATNDLFNKLQSAYRSSHSTETALTKVLNDLLLSVDQGKVSVLTLLDLSAAFDTIDHTILLSRLDHVFGIRSTALHWFSSYLSNRLQTVSINNFESDPALMSYGVPQGSVLGPLLFVLYTTPLSDIITSHSVVHHSFADDTQLQKSADPSQLDSLILSMQECILDVKSWMTFNKLKLNDDKTEAMKISSPRMSTSVSFPDSLVVGNATVPFSQSAKNLGVFLDSDLSMHSQVMNIIRTVNYELRRIGSIRHFLSVQATKTLVSAFISSRIDYCNALLVGCPHSLTVRIQKLQNNAARLTLRIPRTEHITPHLRTLHWLPVEARIKYKIACLCFSAVHSTGPVYLSELIKLYRPSRTLRSSSDTLLLSVPRVRTKTFGERSFFFSAPKIWNSLPLTIRSCDSPSSFRSSLKTYMFKSYLQ